MDFEKQKFFDDCYRGENRHIPKWAREEHLEMNVPQKELWNYLEDEPKSSSPKMTGIYRLVVVFLFAGSTFFDRGQSLFPGNCRIPDGKLDAQYRRFKYQ